MANTNHLERLKASITEDNHCMAWNQWRKTNPAMKIDLRGAHLSRLYCSNTARLAGHLTGVDLRDADLYGADLTLARLCTAELQDAELSGANLTDADLTDTNLKHALLVGACLSGANLRNACLDTTTLTRANLTHATLNNANVRNATFTDATLNGAHLEGVDLTGAQLSGAQFRNAILIGANFTEADLSNTDFCDANLSDTDLSLADLSGTDLRGANLRGSDLRRVIFNSFFMRVNPHLAKTDVTGALVDTKTFVDADTSGLVGMGSVRYTHPTHSRSLYDIASSFLPVPPPPVAPSRASPLEPPVDSAPGLHPAFEVPSSRGHLATPSVDTTQIVRRRPLLELPIVSPHAIFISYSRMDMAFVDALATSLQSAGFTPWVDRGKLAGGQSWFDEIEAAIDACAVFLLVLAPAAIRSKYVKSEYLQAFAQDKTIIPLDYRDCKVPMTLNSLQIIDFRTVPYTHSVQQLFKAIERHISK